MSKLINEIKARQTNNRYAEFSPVPTSLLDFKSECAKVSSYDYNYEYEISVLLGCKIIVPGQQLDFAQNRVRRQVAEYVFGEFRPLLIEIIQAAYDRDFSKVIEKAASIEENMFYGE